MPAWGERKKTFEALGMPVPIAPVKSKSASAGGGVQHLNNTSQGLLTSHTTGSATQPPHAPIQKVLIALTPEREEEIKQAKLRKIAKSKERKETVKLEKKRLKKLSKPFELIDTNLPNDGLVHEVSPFRPRGPAGAGVGSVSVLGDSNAMFPSSGVTSSVDVEFPGLHSSRPTTAWDMIGPSGFDADLLKSSTDRDTLGSSGNYKIFGEPVITPVALGSVSQVDTDRMSATSASSNGDTTGAEAGGSETHSLVNHSSDDLQDSFPSSGHISSGRGERGRGRGRAGRSRGEGRGDGRGEGRGEGRGMSAYNKQFGSRDARNIPRTEGPTSGPTHTHGHPHNRIDKGDVREGWNGYHGKNDVRGDTLVPLRKAGDPVMSPIGTHSSSSSRRRGTEESSNDNRGMCVFVCVCIHVCACMCV